MLARKLLANKGLDVLEIALIVIGHQGDGLTKCARTARATNAVNIVFGCVRQVVIDDRRQLCNIESSGGHIGGHQHLDLVLLETIKGAQALILALVAVNGICGNALSHEFTGQSARTNLGVGKDNHLTQAQGLDQLNHSGTLGLGPIEPIDLLGDILSRGIAPGDFYRHGVLFEKRLAEFADLGREGGGEEQALALLGQEIHDALEVW